MINPVSSSHASTANQATQSALPNVQAQQTESLPQDTVSLKSTGAAGQGDAGK
jgi:hypothetical protein